MIADYIFFLIKALVFSLSPFVKAKNHEVIAIVRVDTILVPNKRIQPCSIPDRNAKHTRVEIQVTIKTPLNVCLKKYPNVIPIKGLFTVMRGMKINR